MTPALRFTFFVLLAALAASPAPVLAGDPSQDRPSFAVTDSLGRRVGIPPRVRRIISLEPEITRIIVALGGGDRLVGLDFFLRHHDHLFPLLFPAGAGLPVVSNQGQDPNYELVLKLRPDVLFSSPSEFQSTETMQIKLRTPVAALASSGKFDNLLDEIETVGRVIGREDRARELADYFRKRVGAVRQALRVAPAGTGPRVYLAFWGSPLRTPVSYEPVDAAGGTNCAAGLLPSYLGAAGATVPLEQILRWDPDVILVQGNYLPGDRTVTVEGILRDPRLASLKAVRAGRVHYTFGFWYWWDPALVLVETLYLARLFHPRQFPDFDFEKEGNKIFREFYGVDGAFTALAKVLNCDEWVRN
ncbi:MAG: ABC transporter substrate-binding protein [Candidatus Aminicenantales bacterium]